MDDKYNWDLTQIFKNDEDFNNRKMNCTKF